MGVDVVALLHVLQDVVEVGGHALGLQFVEAALGADAGRGGDKYLQFGIGEDGGADVAPVHHDALVLAHLLLLGHHSGAHEGDGGDGADVVAHLQRANLLLDALTVQIGVGAPRLGIEHKRDMDIGHLGLQRRRVYAAVLTEEAPAEGVEGDAAIHGARVNIDVADLTGQVLGHRALSARTVAVDGNGYFLHNAYDMFIRMDDALTWYLP